jgi:hypothetical protein
MSKKKVDGCGFPHGDVTGRVGIGSRIATCTYDHGVEILGGMAPDGHYGITLGHDGKMPIVMSTWKDEHGNDIQAPRIEPATDALRRLTLMMAYAQLVLGVGFPDEQAMTDAIDGLAGRMG